MSWGCTCAVDWLNSALSPVVYGDIALSINTQYNTNTIQSTGLAEAWSLKCSVSETSSSAGEPELVMEIAYFFPSKAVWPVGLGG